MRRLGWTILRCGIAALLIVVLTRSGVIRWEAVGRLFSAWPVTLLALSLFLVDFAVTAYRTCVLVRPHGFGLSAWDAIRLSAVGNLFAQLLPSAGGDLVRMFYAAKDAAGRRFEVATLLFLDRVIGLLGMLLLPLLAIPFYGDLVARSKPLQALLLGAAAMSTVLIGAFAIALSERARNASLIRLVLARFPLGGFPTRLLDTVHAFRGHVGALAISMGLSLAAHALSCIVIWMLVDVMSTQRPPASVGFLAALGFVANSVPLTPGGVGVGEAAFDSLFSLAGVTSGAEAMLGWRLLLLTLVPTGLVVYLGGRRRFLRAQQAT
jgi:uncharacterized membrane protein YbhN (UPF0104 family)